MALQRSHLDDTNEEESDYGSGGTPFDDFDDPSPFLRPRGGSIYVPYDGQGTPPKLPFWGTANPDSDHSTRAEFARRESVFISNEGSFTPRYERCQSIFVANDGPDPVRNGSIFIPTEQPIDCPSQEKDIPKRKVQAPCPSDAIAAILARTDLH
jgi:hypothetical protein